MDLGKYLKIGLGWWWLIVLSVALSATVSYVYSQRMPRIYAARTTLMVGSNIIQNPNPDMQNMGAILNLAEVYSEMSRRKLVTQAVIDRLGLEISPDELSSMISTNVIPNAQLLEVFVMDVHPQRAQLLANAVAEELILQSPTGAGEQQERDNFIKVQLQELQVKIEDTDRRIKELQDSLGTLTSAVEIAEAQSKLTELEALRNQYQNNYNQFLSNISEAGINRLAIFEPATEPTVPISPNIKMNVLVAAVAGLVLAIVAIILLEFFNDILVWQPEDIQPILGLPILGAVGKIAVGKDKLISQDELWSPEVDTLRNLRSNIYLAAVEQTLTKLLVTSAMPNEGKSFISANLAAVIASPGSSVAAIIASPGTRVILVDADLRNPSLHEVFDMPNLLGLTDVLALPEAAVEGMLEKALRPTRIENLSLLPAGRSPLDPGYLLNSPRFANLLDLLGTKADLVIVDSAPILSAVETRFLINVVDGTVLVVSHNQTRRRTLQKAVNYLQTKSDNKLLGLVFNRVRLSVSYDYTTRLRPQQLQQANLISSRRQPALVEKLWPFSRGRSAESTPTTLTLPEVADYLGVGRDTAQRWCEEGRLPAIKNGGRWSVHLEDLNEFIGAYQGNGVREDKEFIEDAMFVQSDTDSHQKLANGQEHIEAELPTSRRRSAKPEKVNS